jgi:hypothetical protein
MDGIMTSSTAEIVSNCGCVAVRVVKLCVASEVVTILNFLSSLLGFVKRLTKSCCLTSQALIRAAQVVVDVTDASGDGSCEGFLPPEPTASVTTFSLYAVFDVLDAFRW